MTDRYCGFVVTLDEDRRSDECEDIIKALSMVKGVLSVRPNLGGGELAMAEDRVKHQYYMSMHDAVRGVFGEGTADRHRSITPPPPGERFIEPWQWSTIFFISLATALAIYMVGVSMKDDRVEALQQMEKACKAK